MYSSFHAASIYLKEFYRSIHVKSPDRPNVKDQYKMNDCKMGLNATRNFDPSLQDLDRYKRERDAMMWITKDVLIKFYQYIQELESDDIYGTDDEIIDSFLLNEPLNKRSE